MKENINNSYMLKPAPMFQIDLVHHFSMDRKKDIPLKHSFFLKILLWLLFSLSVILIAGGIFVFDSSISFVLIVAGLIDFICSFVLLHETWHRNQ
ncbi:MAG TPA: hypothetical protein VKT28_19020 [Puia sp.]|nr:hypothetical protein [Puia sp.]